MFRYWKGGVILILTKALFANRKPSLVGMEPLPIRHQLCSETKIKEKIFSKRKLDTKENDPKVSEVYGYTRSVVKIWCVLYTASVERGKDRTRSLPLHALLLHTSFSL